MTASGAAVRCQAVAEAARNHGSSTFCHADSNDAPRCSETPGDLMRAIFFDPSRPLYQPAQTPPGQCFDFISRAAKIWLALTFRSLIPQTPAMDSQRLNGNKLPAFSIPKFLRATFRSPAK